LLLLEIAGRRSRLALFRLLVGHVRARLLTGEPGAHGVVAHHLLIGGELRLVVELVRGELRV
jgi:hypothetical protein